MLPRLQSFLRFLSHSESIYIVVVSLVRNVEDQIDYWLSFLKFQIDFNQSDSFRIFVIGSKSDLIKDEIELRKKTLKLNEQLEKYKIQFSNEFQSQNDPIINPPLIVSSKNLTNIDKLKSNISQQAHNILGCTSKTFPRTYLDCHNYIRSFKALVFDAPTTIPNRVYLFLHNIGEIIYYSGGMNSLK